MKWNKLKESALPAGKEVGKHLQERVQMIQNKVAGFLNKKTEGWSPRKIKVALLLFCLLTGNLCLYIACKAFLYANGPPAKTTISPVLRSGHVRPPEGLIREDSLREKFDKPYKKQ